MQAILLVRQVVFTIMREAAITVLRITLPNIKGSTTGGFALNAHHLLLEAAALPAPARQVVSTIFHQVVTIV